MNHKLIGALSPRRAFAPIRPSNAGSILVRSRDEAVYTPDGLEIELFEVCGSSFAVIGMAEEEDSTGVE